MFGLRSNGCFLTSAPCRDEITSTALLIAWANRGSTLSSCWYMMVYGNIQSTNIVLRITRDNANPTKKGLKARIDHMKLNYDMIFLLLYIYIYTLQMIFKYLSSPYDNLYIMYVYLYSLSRILTFVSFPPVKHVLLISLFIHHSVSQKRVYNNSKMYFM